MIQIIVAYLFRLLHAVKSVIGPALLFVGWQTCSYFPLQRHGPFSAKDEDANVHSYLRLQRTRGHEILPLLPKGVHLGVGQFWKQNPSEVGLL